MNDGAASILGLPAVTLSNCALAYAGYGAALLQQSSTRSRISKEVPEATESGDELTAANSLIIAGVYYSVLGNADALVAFRAAARCFQLKGRVGALVLGICGGVSPAALTRSLDWEAVELATPDDLAGLLLFNAWNRVSPAKLQAEVPRMLFKRMRERATGRVGSSGIPATLIERFDNATSDVGLGRPLGHEITNALVAILERYVQAVQEASADVFHWQRLLSRLLPVPPEILAVSCIYVRATNDRTFASLRESTDARALVPLDVAVGLLNPSPGDGPVELREYLTHFAQNPSYKNEPEKGW